MDLTFGEQLLLLLKRKNMTIPEYASLLEERTGVPCSSQYLNQQLKKDNFLEQDMSILAAALDRRVVISLEPLSSAEDTEEFSMFSSHRTSQGHIQMQEDVLAEAETAAKTRAVEAKVPAIEAEAPVVEAEVPADETEAQSVETQIPSAEAGTQSVEAGTQSVEAGTQSAETGSHFVEAGSQSVEAGSQSVEAGTQSVETGSHPVEAGTGTAKAPTAATEHNGDQTDPAALQDAPALSSTAQAPEESATIQDSTAGQPLSDQDQLIRQVTQSLREVIQKKPSGNTVRTQAPLALSPDSINPYTNEEYLNNTVRKHPDQDRYIQVYDITEHKWIDVPENYFQKFQAVKRKIMGKDYTAPIYI